MTIDNDHAAPFHVTSRDKKERYSTTSIAREGTQ